MPTVWNGLADEARKAVSELLQKEGMEAAKLTADELTALLVRVAVPVAAATVADSDAGDAVPTARLAQSLAVLKDQEWADAQWLLMEADNAERARALLKTVLDWAGKIGGSLVLQAAKIGLDGAFDKLNK
jgi:nucleotide-binding universal stress UspA family protein